MGIEVGTATLIGMMMAGGASAGASVYASKKQSSAARRAGDMDAAAADKQMAYLRQKDEQERQDKLAADAEAKRQFDETQHQNYDQWALREQHLAPYRSIGEGATTALSKLIGIPLNTQAFAPPPYRGPGADSTANTPGAPNGPLPNAPNDPAQLDSFIKLQLASTGGDPNTSPYWVQKWPGLVERGQQLNDPQYPVKRLLGMGAGPQDAPKSGPFAGMSSPTSTSAPSQTLFNLIGPPQTTTSVPLNNLMPMVRTPALTPEPMTAGISLRDLLMDPRRSASSYA